MRKLGEMAWLLQGFVILQMAGDLFCRSDRSGSPRVADLYWNTTNSIFQISNTDHIIDVNKGVVGHQYDRVNIICPYYTTPEGRRRGERHIIYSVGREDYDLCRLSGRPRQVAQCTQPGERQIYTISFRSFSPMPGSLEFEPGKDYYFISTSQPGYLESKEGGYCAKNNMKVTFKVAPRIQQQFTAQKVRQAPIKLLGERESETRVRYNLSPLENEAPVKATRVERRGRTRNKVPPGGSGWQNDFIPAAFDSTSSSSSTCLQVCQGLLLVFLLVAAALC